MKIVKAEVFVTCPGRNFVTLKITTEDGITGLGDATLNGRELSVASYLQDHLCPQLIGRDAHRIEDIWQFFYKGAYWRRGPVTMSAISAVDMALWDIKAKAANMPLYQLLGGELTRDFLRYGLPIMGGQVVWSVNMLGQTMILGRYDAGVIAAVSIANMLHNMMYIAMNGLSSAVGIITGKTVGSGRMEKIREYSRTTQVIFLGLGILSGIAVHFLRDPFIGLYGASDAAVAYAREFINVISVTIIGTCYQAACLFGLVKSGGDISFVFRNDTIFVFLVVLPSAIIASYLGAPPWVVFACLKCDQILKCFVAVVKINRYNWMKNLTRETNEV